MLYFAWPQVGRSNWNSFARPLMPFVLHVLQNTALSSWPNCQNWKTSSKAKASLSKIGSPSPILSQVQGEGTVLPMFVLKRLHLIFQSPSSFVWFSSSFLTSAQTRQLIPVFCKDIDDRWFWGSDPIESSERQIINGSQLLKTEGHAHLFRSGSTFALMPFSSSINLTVWIKKTRPCMNLSWLILGRRWSLRTSSFIILYPSLGEDCEWRCQASNAAEISAMELANCAPKRSATLSQGHVTTCSNVYKSHYVTYLQMPKNSFAQSWTMNGLQTVTKNMETKWWWIRCLAFQKTYWATVYARIAKRGSLILSLSTKEAPESLALHGYIRAVNSPASTSHSFQRRVHIPRQPHSAPDVTTNRPTQVFDGFGPI